MGGRSIPLLLLTVCLASGGCTPALPPLVPVTSKYLDPKGQFTLYVSNQSFALSPVDIEIRVNGEVVVHDYFDVKNQHNWKQFTLALPPGPYTLNVSSRRGGAELTKDFVVKDKHWAVVDYWYYPRSHYMPTPRKLTFSMRDEPIYFK